MLNEPTVEENVEELTDELTELKKRAELMGIDFHPSIGLPKLKVKVNEVLKASKAKPEVVVKKETDAQMRLRVKKTALRHKRIRITCMNPNKREWSGELFTTGNTITGTVKVFVPFNAEWHVPQIIYNQIKQRKCQVFTTAKDVRGNKTRRGELINEFAIEELPALTPKGLKDLAQRQAMANGTSE